jgi:hypothetical protein
LPRLGDRGHYGLGFNVLKEAKDKLESFTGYVAVLVTATATLGSFLGSVLDPRARPALLIFAGLLFAIAALAQKPAKSALVDTSGRPLEIKPATRRFIWALFGFFCLCCGTGEFIIRSFGIVPLAIIDGSYFEVHHESGAYEKWPFKRIPYTSDEMKEWSDEVKTYRTRTDIDNFEIANPITVSDASVLYSNPLGEHFMFDIRKTEATDRVTIEDIEITVHNFEEVPPFAMGGAANVYNNYIVVVNLDRLKHALPWKFHAELLLDNPSTKEVVPWNRKTIRLTDQSEQRFMVKLAARTAGIYTYSASIVVKDAVGARVKIDLIKPSSPRSCMFEGGTLSTPPNAP